MGGVWIDWLLLFVLLVALSAALAVGLVAVGLRWIVRQIER